MVPDGLLAEVKNYLDITWTDAATDSKVSGIIARGIVCLNDKAGKELDYSTEGSPKELLLEYCKYARNGILKDFITDFAPFLTNLRAGNGGAYGNKTSTV